MIITENIVQIEYYGIKEVRHLSNETFVLRFDKNNMIFTPGQFVVLGLEGEKEKREYSIYSGQHEPFLEVLIRAIPNGDVSNKLQALKKGEKIIVNGPLGFFRIKEDDIYTKKFIFIATGTGISPFHSFVKSYPGLNYKIIHGVRNSFEKYDSFEYNKNSYVSCVTGDTEGDYHGRITSYLKENTLTGDEEIYLCGNSDMIYEAGIILREMGIKRKQLHTEVYF